MNEDLKKQLLYHIQRLAALSEEIQGASMTAPAVGLKEQIKNHLQGWLEGMEDAAKIAASFEPNEKQPGITYASSKIEEERAKRIPF